MEICFNPSLSDNSNAYHNFTSNYLTTTYSHETLSSRFSKNSGVFSPDSQNKYLLGTPCILVSVVDLLHHSKSAALCYITRTKRVD